MNITEKILAWNSGKKSVKPGDIIEARVDIALVHEKSGPGFFHNFEKLDKEIWDKDKVVVIGDHNEEFSQLYRKATYDLNPNQTSQKFSQRLIDQLKNIERAQEIMVYFDFGLEPYWGTHLKKNKNRNEHFEKNTNIYLKANISFYMKS